jgi:glycosyltransferase involved in cell wall biosynthesis
MCAEALALGLAPPAKLKLLGDGSSNGVDLGRFSPGPSDVRDRLGLPRDSPVVGFVGRLTFDKGLPELMEAFDTILESERERTCCLWAGSMPQKTRSVPICVPG